LRRKQVASAIILGLLLAIIPASIGLARTQPPPTFSAGLPSTLELRTYYLQAWAETLGLSLRELTFNLLKGKTLAEIALTQGIASDQLGSLQVTVQNKALSLAFNDTNYPATEKINLQRCSEPDWEKRQGTKRQFQFATHTTTIPFWYRNWLLHCDKYLIYW
jgi:hypothetical protein